MAAERDLGRLLRGLRPELNPGRFVFTTVPGLSCNVIAGYHHDHLFVPHDRAAEAVTVLEALVQRATGDDSSPG